MLADAGHVHSNVLPITEDKRVLVRSIRYRSLDDANLMKQTYEAALACFQSDDDIVRVTQTCIAIIDDF